MEYSPISGKITIHNLQWELMIHTVAAKHHTIPLSPDSIECPIDSSRCPCLIDTVTEAHSSLRNPPKVKPGLASISLWPQSLCSLSHLMLPLLVLKVNQKSVGWTPAIVNALSFHWFGSQMLGWEKTSDTEMIQDIKICLQASTSPQCLWMSLSLP